MVGFGHGGDFVALVETAAVTEVRLYVVHGLLLQELPESPTGI